MHSIDRTMGAEKACFCDVLTAVSEIRAERVLAIVNDEDNVRGAALVMASASPSPETLRLMVSLTCGLVFMAVTEADLRQVRLPPSLEKNFMLGAISPQASQSDCLGQYSDEGVRTHPIIPLTTRKNAVLRYSRPAECIVELAELAGGGMYCFFSSFGSDKSAYVSASLHKAMETHSLRVLSTADLTSVKQDVKRCFRSEL